jgi:hypothetical protein
VVVVERDASVIECRCVMLNHMSGAIAADYARVHLDVVAAGWGSSRMWECPDTGVQWAAPGGHRDPVAQLRRVDR